MNIKNNILFFVDKEGNKTKGYKPDGKLRMRIRYEAGKVDFNVGYRVDITKWNIDTQRCKAGTSHSIKKVFASEINNEIQRLETLAINTFKSFEVLKIVPSTAEFRNAFNIANGKISTNTISNENIFFHFDEFTKECGSQNDWTESTYEKFASIKNHLLGFDRKLTYDSLNESKLTDYVNYLRDEKNMRNSTISKNISFLKWFLRWTIKKQYNTNNIFEYYKPKLKTTDKKVIFLDWDELTLFRNFSIPSTKQYLERVRDVFLFQCYTSLRYSDVYNLKKTDIKIDTIEITTVKTADSLVIDLNDYSRAILHKYKDVHFENEKALPVISNQKMNHYLKELAKLVGLDEPIRETYYKGNERIDTVRPKHELLGTHAGRRTFICHSLAMGIPAQTVMKWTGHNDYKAMKPYIAVADKTKQEAMSLWNKQAHKDSLLDQLKELSEGELLELLAKR